MVEWEQGEPSLGGAGNPIWPLVHTHDCCRWYMDPSCLLFLIIEVYFNPTNMLTLIMLYPIYNLRTWTLGCADGFMFKE